ncbi:MAG TPA: hypothetical protein VFY80_09640 [Burkholderiales bacterium]|nr:hypothetical protein [Burkholderiales bacterium]
MTKRLGLITAGAALAIASGSAMAGGDVSFGISIGVPVAPAPVYVAPPPVVYAPPPRVYYAPATVYYAPAYYAPVVRYKPKHWHKHHYRHW